MQFESILYSNGSVALFCQNRQKHTDTQFSCSLYVLRVSITRPYGVMDIRYGLSDKRVCLHRVAQNRTRRRTLSRQLARAVFALQFPDVVSFPRLYVLQRFHSNPHSIANTRCEYTFSPRSNM